MESWKASTMSEQLTFEPQPKQEGELIFSLTVPGRLPSWNELLGMEHWARYKLKDEIQVAFLSALYQSASDSSTKTTSQKSIMLTAAATLACYRKTARERRELKSASKKLMKGRRKKSRSKSTGSDKPVPF